VREAGSGKEHAIKANLVGLVVDLVLITGTRWDFNDYVKDHLCLFLVGLDVQLKNLG
jgi:hypothetical protein